MRTFVLLLVTSAMSIGLTAQSRAAWTTEGCIQDAKDCSTVCKDSNFRDVLKLDKCLKDCASEYKFCLSMVPKSSIDPGTPPPSPIPQGKSGLGTPPIGGAR